MSKYRYVRIKFLVDRLNAIINSTDPRYTESDKESARIKLATLWLDPEAVKKYDEECREENKKIENVRLKEEQEEREITKATSMDLPLDYENLFANDERVKGVHYDSVSDGLVASIVNLGRVDIEYISSVTGESLKDVIKTLRGSIFQNPEKWEQCFYKGWETADEYLSGTLRRKYKIAKDANIKYRGWFDDNLKALEGVLGKGLTSDDIYITLGSPWVDTKTIDEFIAYLLGKPYGYSETYGKVKHDVITGTWEIPNKSVYSTEPRSYKTYGTRKIDAIHIIERTLNMKNVVVTDEKVDPLDRKKTKRVVNKSETSVALEKQKLIIEQFKKWVWKDEKRKEKLIDIFEFKYGSYRKRRFNGEFMNFPTLDQSVTLYPYQKNAIARILLSPNTLLAHEVGAGKTYVMVVAGMELRRMGISKKNLYVVPNNIVGQWEGIFKKLYPNAKVLCVEPNGFTPAKRNKVLNDIKDNEYDAVIMASSCFDMIPLSVDYYVQKLQEKVAELDKILSDGAIKHTKSIQNKSDKLKQEIREITSSEKKKKDIVCFDKLGISRLFVDEAHNYKNVPIDTKIEKVLGISRTGSEKCRLMLDKVRHVQKTNNGGGVVLATGTPITNSITDVFIMQKYLQDGELALLDVQNFDSWIGMFAEKETQFEIDVDTSSYRLATRFSKFHNLTELTGMLSSIADFHKMEGCCDLPEFNGYKDILVPKSDELTEYLKVISKRADDVRNGYVKRTEDNMLCITNDGRMAALDVRLVDEKVKFNIQSKVMACARNVWKYYIESINQNSTQLVFCDISTPKEGFNIYDDLKKLLIMMGVPSEDVSYIHDATTEKKREILFEKVRNGQIRILLGSTSKLGLGVNVQDKLLVLHHLSVPWRPADMVQREGRIIRVGNTNKEVFIYRYITEGSFDAYSWQLLETKQKFISALLSGSLTERDGVDIDDVVLSYAEVKALAIGNPLIKKRVEAANELSRYYNLQRKLVEAREMLAMELAEMPGQEERYCQLIDKTEDDRDFYERNKQVFDVEFKKVLREKLFSEAKAYTFMDEEKVVDNYQGFDVILPANMIPENIYIILQRTGRYYVEVGEGEKGLLIRIDNCLEGLGNKVDKYKAKLIDLIRRKRTIEEELAKDESYTDEIESCKRRLKRIDKQLGVENNG